MDFFNFKDSRLYVEDLEVAKLACEYETPLYIYSMATLQRHIAAFNRALAGRPHLICYAVKANSNLTLLNLMARAGWGFDVVSEGELRRVLKAGGDPRKVVFSGVGKSESELRLALSVGIKCLNVESEAELQLLERLCAELKISAPVALRVNPDVDAKTHPAISTGLKNNKFGIPVAQARELYLHYKNHPYLKMCGLDAHIGSQMTSVEPILHSAEKLLTLWTELHSQGLELEHLDLGGGLGVVYRHETPPQPYDYYHAVSEKLAAFPGELCIEPGRAVVANAGVLVTKVLRLKDNGQKHFCVVDGSMSDLIRPALYDADMTIVNCNEHEGTPLLYEVVGPVCESDDFLGHERSLAVSPGDFLAVRGAGAYGSSMSSNYNSRPLCCELLVDEDRVQVIRKRQSYEQLWENELL